MTKTVGKITIEETREIQQLDEHRNSLAELAMVLSPDAEPALFEKMTRDIAETEENFQLWWDRMYQKYDWESAEGGHWWVRFDTREIVLETKQ